MIAQYVESNKLVDVGKDKLCGWLPPTERTTAQHAVNDSMIATMAPFRLVGRSAEPKDGKSLLWDGVRSLTDGKDLLCFYQLEGSCVGEGKAKAEWYVMYMEILRGELEKAIMPYMPYGYGMSRVCAGIHSNQHGSTGTGAALAATKYGILRSDLPDLKQWTVRDQTLTWGSELENMWMNGAPSSYYPEGQHHLIKSTALVTNLDDLEAGLVNHYPATCASNWGGVMKPSVKEGVLLNHHADTWSHQMMVCGVWRHLVLGRIWYIQNSWSQDAHGADPAGGPLGGFWIIDKDMQYIVDQREVFLYSQFDGFPADVIPWIF